MLDLRSNQSEEPNKQAKAGIPEVGQTVEVDAGPRLRKAVERKADLSSTRSIINRRSADSTALYSSIIGLVIALGAGAIALFFSGNEQNQAAQNRALFGQAQAELSNQPILGQLSRIRKVSRQLDTFSSSGLGATPWPDLIDIFAGLVPGAVSVSSSEYDSEEALLTIEGEAANHFEVANLIKSLENSPRFDQPLLLATTFSEDPERTVVVFTVTANYIPVSQADQNSNTTNLDQNSSTTTGVSNGQ